MSSNEAVDIELRRADLRIKRLDVIAKFIGTAVLLLGIAVPFYQYTRTLEKDRQDRADKKATDEVQQKKQAEAALREAQKPFLQRQSELYFSATSAAAKLATLEKGSERDNARKQFYQLYWGDLSVVEDELVEQAMVRFHKTLEAYEAGSVDESALQQKSLELAHACRESMARGWGYQRK